MTKAELLTILQQEVHAVSDDFSAQTGEDKLANELNAITTAQRELWDLPVTDNFQITWLIKRAKRHLLFFMATSAARKFGTSEYKLEQRFKNYMQLIKFMDQEYESALKKYPEIFPEPSNGSINSYELFGSVIDAGFQYDKVGKSTTYSSNNVVLITPNDES